MNCLNMVEYEGIHIVKNGEDVAKLTRASSVKKGIASKLFGILHKDADLKKSREERLSKIYIRILIDTNIVIDALTGHEPFVEKLSGDIPDFGN